MDTSISLSDISVDNLRIDDLEKFIVDNDIKVSRKRMKQLVLMSSASYSSYKLGVTIHSCCKVYY